MDTTTQSDREASTGVEVLNAEKQHALLTTIPAADLAEIGLTPADLPAVAECASKFDASNSLAISQWGREIGSHTASYTDDLLAEVNSKDLGEVGAKLSKIVVTAKSLGRHALSDSRSRVPLIGPVIDRFKMTRDKAIVHFENSRDLISDLIGEVDRMQQGLSDRVELMDSRYAGVKEEYRLRGINLAAALVKLSEMREEVAQMRRQDITPVLAQEISDLDWRISNLDKRIADLRVAQQATYQMLPKIRMVQAAGIGLIDKFHTIKEVTFPLWKGEFMLGLAINEQKNGVELAETIDDATNEFAVRQAELLKRTSVATARANQRLVMDVSTLDKVNDLLISTVEEVVSIHQEGQRARRQLATQLSDIRGRLESSMVRQTRLLSGGATPPSLNSH
ncbi:toxic anion resistance protein [Burkholderia gladioli]|uniref:toxic anion resistance protein n=1 Tax=Burkholderia gladioli TaxID=28095 RepID=UPI00163F6564|nr:toxic anion resistance protein [Burkholderia gladioli]